MSSPSAYSICKSGTGTIASQDMIFRSFTEAREFVHKLKLKGQEEWGKYRKGDLPNLPPKPDDIPTNPNRTYKNEGWDGWGDWLNTGAIATRGMIYRHFEEAKDFVHELKFKSRSEWEIYCKGGFSDLPPKPDDISANPNRTYKNKGWIGIGDWLGTGNIATNLRKYSPFEEARDFVHKLKLQGEAEWREYCKDGFSDLPPKPDSIPAAPWNTYKKEGWDGWGDWIGTGNIATQSVIYRSFKEAKDFVHKLELKSGNEWREYCMGGFSDLPPKPDDIPANPNRTYKKDGWKGMGDWIGTGNIATNLRKYSPFTEAREFVHKLKLKSQEEWGKYRKGDLPTLPPKPDDIPTNPNITYKKDGWKGYRDWLGYR